MDCMECNINIYKLEELAECKIYDISQTYNALYVDKGKGEKLIDYLELFGVVAELDEQSDEIINIKNGRIISESFGNGLLGDGSIKPSFTIRIDTMKRII